MSLLEDELAKLPTARLREIADSGVPTAAAAARAELDARPEPPPDPLTPLRHSIFPPQPAL